MFRHVIRYIWRWFRYYRHDLFIDLKHRPDIWGK